VKKINGIVLVWSLLLLAILLVTINASAAVVYNIEIPISGTVFNPCNGETVTFTGVDHYVASVTLNASGGFQSDAHDNIHVTATGDQGNSYVGNQEDHYTLNGRVGLVQSYPTTFSEISEGAAPNFEIHTLQHFTVNHNGTVTVFFSTYTSSCRG
jgi:hypothetical protein